MTFLKTFQIEASSKLNRALIIGIPLVTILTFAYDDLKSQVAANTASNKALTIAVGKNRFDSYATFCLQQMTNCLTTSFLRQDQEANQQCLPARNQCLNKAMSEYHKYLADIGEKDASVPLSVPSVPEQQAPTSEPDSI